MDKLIQKIQASRNVADPVLYGGALQDNTDYYYTANRFASQSDVPDGPPKIFRNYGATAELDNRPFMSLGLQAPRNPQQEALNEYFNRKRIADFAVAQSRMNISEQMAKQAELVANNVIRDEMDRRAGIRRSVLEATGLTPGQIQQEMAADALGGVNRNVLDIRDRQVQDAVNLYYNLNNIPLPITVPSGMQTAVAATVPTEVAGELPLDDAEGVAAADGGGLEQPQFVFGGPAEEEEDEDAAPAYGDADWGGEEFDGAAGGGNWTAPLPEEVRGLGLGGYVGVDPNVARSVERWGRLECARYIVRNNITSVPALLTEGRLKAASTIANQNTVGDLRNIVAEHMTQATRLSLSNNQGIGGGK
jgi:hypothetical protein